MGLSSVSYDPKLRDKYFRAIISCIFMFEQGIILKNTEEEIIIRTLYEKKLKKCGKNAEKGAYNR